MPAVRASNIIAMVVAIGCGALAVGAAVAQGARPSDDQASAARGRALAEQRCLSCHQLERHADPLTPGAPTFLSLKARFSRTALPMRLKEIGENGHYDTERDTYGMPAVDLTASQTRDIADYIHSLEPTAAPHG
jgi:cytochrome c